MRDWSTSIREKAENTPLNPNIEMKLLKTKLIIAGLFAAGSVSAAPLTLEGMGIQKQWIDTEAGINEMPGFVWGNSHTAMADKIGLHVLFANGVEGTIAYSGVATKWGTTGPTIGTLISATGFFASYATAGLHFLNNTPAGGTLPIAWVFNPSTPFGSNVELDYFDNSFGSEFRVTTAGWNSVQITTYSSSAPVAAPDGGSSIALLGLAMTAAAGFRRKFGI